MDMCPFVKINTNRIYPSYSMKTYTDGCKVRRLKSTTYIKNREIITWNGEDLSL